MRLHATCTALAVVLLALTGCTSTPASAPSSSPDSTASATVERTAPTIAPLKVTAEPSPTTPEAIYLDRVRTGLKGTQLADASDAQLLDAARDACSQLAAAKPYKDISVVEGDIQGEGGWYKYSAPIVVYGGMNLCPDVYPSDAIHP